MAVSKTSLKLIIIVFLLACCAVIALSYAKIIHIYCGYLAGLYMVAFALYWYDKAQAKSGGWRTPEANLHIFGIAAWPGAYLGMYYCRHKTRKQPFKFVFWLTGLLHIGVVLYVLEHAGMLNTGITNLIKL